MKKIIIAFVLLLIIAAAFLFPVTIQQPVTIKASFFNVYQQLAKADNWKKWRTDLRGTWLTDSTKITTEQNDHTVVLTSSNSHLNIKINGYDFVVEEQTGTKTSNYVYTVIPEKLPNVTELYTTQKISFIKWMFNKAFSNTVPTSHLADLKNYMETVSLYYGYSIVKTKVTDTNIVVLKNLVKAENKFTVAAKMLDTLKRFVAANHLKQTQPMMAQFLPKANNSVQVNIGLPINAKANTTNNITYMIMPKNGNLYTVKFKGQFRDRDKVFNALHRYYNDHGIQLPLAPFEIYLNNQLPTNDTSQVDIKINFTSF